MKNILTVYTQHGHTYRFEGATDIFLMNNELHFKYKGVRSGGKKTDAVFHNVAGYTTRDDE
jgi:hypothetical protein